MSEQLPPSDQEAQPQDSAEAGQSSESNHPLSKVTLQEFNTYLDGLTHINQEGRPELSDDDRQQLSKAVEEVRTTVMAYMSQGLSVESALARMEARNLTDQQANYLNKTRAAQSEVLDQLRSDHEALAKVREQVAETVQEQLEQTILDAQAEQAQKAAESRRIIDNLPDPSTPASPEQPTPSAPEAPAAPTPPASESAPAPLPGWERLTEAEKLDRIIEAGRGTAIIHTDLAPDEDVLRKEEGAAKSRYAGLQTFGDGSKGSIRESPLHFHQAPGPYSDVHFEDGTKPRDMSEGVAFIPAMEDITEEHTEERRSGFMGRKKETVTKHHKTGERRLQINGEPAVYFDYGYNHRLMAYETQRQLDMPYYKEINGARDGNVLVLRVMLPESVAQQLRHDIEQNPSFAREIAEKIVLEQGGIPRESWEQGKQYEFGGHLARKNRIKPPYEQIPASQRLYLLEPSPDGHGLLAHKLDQPLRAE